MIVLFIGTMHCQTFGSTDRAQYKESFAYTGNLDVFFNHRFIQQSLVLAWHLNIFVRIMKVIDIHGIKPLGESADLFVSLTKRSSIFLNFRVNLLKQCSKLLISVFLNFLSIFSKWLHKMLAPLFNELAIIWSDLLSHQWFLLWANVYQHHLRDFNVFSFRHLILLFILEHVE